MEEILDYNDKLKKILMGGIFLSLIGFILLIALVYGKCEGSTQNIEYCGSPVKKKYYF